MEPMMKKIGVATASVACALVCALAAPCGAFGQAPESVWAAPQQAILAEDILTGEGDRLSRAVVVANALGPSRMSEEVRVALITLMERLNNERGYARSEGIPLNDVVNGEFFLEVTDVVASLKDPRAIPGLIHSGNYASSWNVVRGLASFGEQALPEILEAIETPRAREGIASTCLRALAVMVEDAAETDLSTTARSEIARIARESLGSQDRARVWYGVPIAVALDEPDLIQMVREISQNTGALTARGIDWDGENMIRKKALQALSERSNAP